MLLCVGCMHVGVWVCFPMSMYVGARTHHQVFPYISPYLIALRQCFSLICKLTICLGWLPCKFLSPTCLCLPVLRLLSQTTMISFWQMLGIQTQVLMLAKHVLLPLRYHSSPVILAL